MSTLRIYSDEAGKMSFSDDEGPFVVSAVGVMGEHPTLGSVEGKAAWVCSKLAKLKAFVHCSLVIPQIGYGKAIKQKLEKMDIMACATRDLVGSNAEFLTDEGLQRRYIIYTHCMQDVIQGPLINAVIREPVDRVEIYFDQMTMATGTRRLLIDQIKSMKERLLDLIEEMENLNPTYAAQKRANVQFDGIHIAWSNEDGTESAADGLKLAHYLASMKYQDLLKGKSTFDAEMKLAGYKNYERNITQQLIRPISQDSIAEWKQNTGLAESEV